MLSTTLPGYLNRRPTPTRVIGRLNTWGDRLVLGFPEADRSCSDLEDELKLEWDISDPRSSARDTN